MNILEELWYGNIEPAEYDTSPSKEYRQMLQLISQALQRRFTTEQLDYILKFEIFIHD